MSIPAGFAKTFLDPAVNWKFATQPEQQLDGRRIYWPRGKVVGGSSAINGMVYIRGLASDYDQWRQMGNEGWSFEDCLPYFRRLEAFADGETELRGGSGPVKITQGEFQNQLSDAFLAACTEVGLNSTSDFNGPKSRRVPAIITRPQATADAIRRAAPTSTPRAPPLELPCRDPRRWSSAW